MKKESILLWEKGEYDYPMALDFVPKMMTYLHEEDDAVRPCMSVVPGGAYCFVSPSEAELPAKRFYDMGYNAFVVTYTVNCICNAPLFDQPMKDLSRAIRYVRANSEGLRIDPGRVVVCGFSAGGHLCGSVCVHYQDVTDANPVYSAFSNRPDAAILSYPVITSGEYAHRGSFDALLGFDADPEKLAYYSLEKQVHDHVPPCFLWQTVNDETVPVENSILFAAALREKSIPHALHVFSEGQHGLSTADEAFSNAYFGEPYTMQQTVTVTEAVRSGKVKVSDEIRKSMEYWASQEIPRIAANEEVAVWPVLAGVWLDKYL